MRIPKEFHFIWLGTDLLPIPQRVYAMTWKRFHPDWKLVLWVNENIEKIPYSVVFDEIRLIDEIDIINKPAFNRACTWAGKSNILRLEIIYSLGGVYVDTDFLCHKAIDPIISGLDCFTVEQDDEFVNNAIFGAIASHPFVHDLITSLQSVCDGTEHCFEIATGPHLFTLKSRGLQNPVILPRHLFYPINYKGFYGGVDTSSFATHMWAYSWEKKD